MTQSPETVLSAEQHFEALRESVWVRFCSRHGSADRERFDDLYAEWWAKELERAARGKPSRAAAPAAFVAEAVHRVLIDDARARGRGLARDEKGSLDIADIEDQHNTPGIDDTAQAASYEALAHRLLTLVTRSLSERETRIFVWSFMYLQTSERTARALGLSVPRVKKDRKKIAGKIGAEVWQVLQGELDLCAVYSEQSLPAIFELLTVHVEDCPTCREALGGVRRGALAVLGPEVLLVGAAESSTHVVSDLMARGYGLLNRGVETLTALPPQGRTAAAVAVAATAIAGGAATVVPVQKSERARPEERQVVSAPDVTPTPTPPADATAVATTPPPPAPVSSEPPKPRPEPTPAATVRARATPAATEPQTTSSAPTATQEEITFEQEAPAPAEPAAEVAAAQPPSDSGESEFGFEGP